MRSKRVSYAEYVTTTEDKSLSKNSVKKVREVGGKPLPIPVLGGVMRLSNKQIQNLRLANGRNGVHYNRILRVRSEGFVVDFASKINFLYWELSNNAEVLSSSQQIICLDQKSSQKKNVYHNNNSSEIQKFASPL